MKSIYQYENYKKYMSDEIRQKARGGYGQMRKLAESLGVHSTLVSQVLAGDKEFTLEQGAAAASYLGLAPLETDYFLNLVQTARAGSRELKAVLARQREVLAAQGRELVRRIPVEGEVSEEKRAIFYSDWVYPAVRQLLGIPGAWNPESIGERLGLEPAKVREALTFLVENGLARKTDEGYRIGAATTHLEATSPWTKPYHVSWRIKSVESMSPKRESDLFFTCPMTLSQKDAEQVRELLLQTIKKVFEKVDPSPSESLHCLDLDWFSL